MLQRIDCPFFTIESVFSTALNYFYTDYHMIPSTTTNLTTPKKNRRKKHKYTSHVNRCFLLHAFSWRSIFLSFFCSFILLRSISLFCLHTGVWAGAKHKNWRNRSTLFFLFDHTHTHWKCVNKFLKGAKEQIYKYLCAATKQRKKRKRARESGIKERRTAWVSETCAKICQNNGHG